VDRILPAQDMSERQAAANTLINLSFFTKCWVFSTEEELATYGRFWSICT